jgi:putative FmdB family regulatory protein
VPTYQYACTECGHGFEQVQSFTDDALTVCPECQGRLRKVFNAVGVVFKGSGFYRTDSRAAATSAKGSDGSKASDGSSGDSGGSGGSSEKKSESTTAGSSSSSSSSASSSASSKSSSSQGSSSAA